MMSLWDALRMNMMISYQELVRTFLNGNSTGYIGNFTEEINLAAANIGISCMGSSHAKKRGCHCCRKKNLFHCHFLVRVNYESMSTL
ncbi:Uncharacterised protein [Enterobacter hormaechei]|nr:Uncharacterised protein [Enterobacter hormaechei]